MSRPYRGAGYRGRFYGHRGRGGYAPPNTDPNVFSVHPRKRFQNIGLKTEDLTVEEIGFYSLEKEGSDAVPRYDRSAMRLLTTRCNPGSSVAVDFNLDEPFAWETPDMEYTSLDEFGPLYTWMKDQGDNDPVQAKRDKIDIITTKGILSELVKIPYNMDAKDAAGWIFGAARVNGKIAIGRVRREGTDKLFLRSRADARADEKRPETFRGRRFEIRMTQTEGDSPESHIGYSPFRTVVSVTLKDLNLLVESGVDAADPKCKDGYPKQYVECAIMPMLMLAPDLWQTVFLYKQRFLRWWANSVFSGVGTVEVGLHYEGRVSQVQSYRLADIPNIVEDKALEIGQPLWSDSESLGFLYELLKYVQRFVQEDYKTKVYEFTCPKDRRAFSCKAILAGDPAVAEHAYLPVDPVDF